MKEVEKFQELRNQLQAEQAKINQLERKLAELKANYPVLEARWIETDDEKEARVLENQMKSVQAEIDQIPLEIKKCKRRIELLEQKLPKYEELAIKELRQVYFEKLNGLVKDLAKKWRETAAVEQKILQLREEAHRDLIKITSHPRVLVPAVPLFFVQKDETVVSINEFGPSFPYSKLKKMIEQLEREGFTVKVQDED